MSEENWRQSGNSTNPNKMGEEDDEGSNIDKSVSSTLMSRWNFFFPLSFQFFFWSTFFKGKLAIVRNLYKVYSSPRTFSGFYISVFAVTFKPNQIIIITSNTFFFIYIFWSSDFILQIIHFFVAILKLWTF